MSRRRQSWTRAGLDENGPVTIPSVSPVEAVAPLFMLERDRLLALLNDLNEADWQRPSPCPGWSVLDLVGHLLGNDLGLLSRRRDDYMGTPAPDGLAEDEFIDWLDQLQMAWVGAARRISPRLVTELLAWTGPRLVDVLGDEDLGERATPVSWAGPQAAPRWLDQLRELSEYWIHRQQLHEAVQRPVDLDPVLLRPILSGLRWALPHRLTQAGLELDGVIRIEVGEPINEQWTLAATDGVWDFSAPTHQHHHQDVATTMVLTGDTAWRLLTNNLREASRPAKVTGDERPATIVLNTRAIIGHAK